jgi:hypothetical protein
MDKSCKDQQNVEKTDKVFYGKRMKERIKRAWEA